MTPPLFCIGPGAQAHYESFCKYLGQMLGGDPMLGDITGRWVIWDGSVYGMASYEDAGTAQQFARLMELDSYIITQVSLEGHQTTPLTVLAFGSVDEVDIPNE
jgi:hypothetical protein